MLQGGPILGIISLSNSFATSVATVPVLVGYIITHPGERIHKDQQKFEIPSGFRHLHEVWGTVPRVGNVAQPPLGKASG